MRRSEKIQAEISETARLETLSDGVFSIAVTLLIIDVVTTGKNVGSGESLAEHLLCEWHTLVAYLVGFLTILVCWINHHQVFKYIKRSNSGLLWVNGFQLSLAAAVPLPTALLASHFRGPDSKTALIIYGLTYVLMAISFSSLWGYAVRFGLTDAGVDPAGHVGMGRIYHFSVVWTLLCLGAVMLSPLLAAVLWTVMFIVFAFPREFSRFMVNGRF